MKSILKRLATGLILCGLLIPGAAAPVWAENIASVSIGLMSNKASKEYLSHMISSKASRQGVHMSLQQLLEAGTAASEKLKEPEHQPQKGVLHMKFKRLNLCIAWGETRNDCP